MVRLLGIQLPDDKRVEYALTMLYGIGWASSAKILNQVKVNKDRKVKDLKEDEIKRLVEVIEKNYKIEGDLREQITGDIKRLREMGSYRGFRHLRNLPVRGQRTRSNARTKRGKRKTVGAFKKEALTKMTTDKAKGGK